MNFYQDIQKYMHNGALVTYGLGSDGKPINSGNGALYTAVAMIYVYEIETKYRLMANHQIAVGVSMLIDLEGRIKRHPTEHQSNNEQWDNVLGVACIAALNRYARDRVRRFAKYTLKNFGVVDTNGVKESRDHLWRSPHILAILYAVSFPLIRFIFAPVIFIASAFMKSDHPGGVQTDFVFKYTAKTVGLPVYGFDETLDDYFDFAVKNYFQDEKHPFRTFAKQCELAIIERNL